MEQLKSFITRHDIFVFDVDDTLLYTFQNGFKKINLAAKELGYQQISFESYAAHYGVDNFEDCIRCWFPNSDIESFKSCYQQMASKCPYLPVCDFSEIQKSLVQKGKLTAILTNGSRNDKLLTKLRICNTDFNLLCGIWGKQDIPAPKPSPLAILPIKELFSTKKILYIGDAKTDQEMATEANISFLQVHSGKDAPFTGAHSISSLKDLQLLLRMEN